MTGVTICLLLLLLFRNQFVFGGGFRAGVDLWIMALWLKFQRFRGQVNGQFHELGIMGPGLS